MAVVHQELSLCPHLTVADNICITDPPRKFGLIDYGAQSRRAEELLKRAEEITRLVASHAPLTLQATKEAILRLRPSVPHGEGNDLVLMCYMSQDFKEGMEAFLGKRKPVWKGK